MKVTPLGKGIGLLLVAGLAVGVWRSWNKIAPEAATKGSMQAPKIDLSTRDDNPSNINVGNGGFVQASDEAGCTDKPEVRLLGYAWNAQMGMLGGIGGPQATKGSLMCKRGVNMRFSRQDDNSKLTEALVAFATELSQGNANPTKGAHFVTIMGDGGAAFIKGANDALKRIGPQYQVKIVDAIGYSRGEDKFMGPAAWKTDPSSSRGGVVAGVLRDGDWNIAQKWLGDNGLRTNPDALNWIAANDYLDAGEKYIAGYSETRPVVRNGKKTGETKTIKVDGVVTWTPGDVNIAMKKGGLVSVVSTKEYSSQMPCVVIGIDKWMKANRSTVQNMILAIGEGGDQVKNSDAALDRASQISAAVYRESGSDAAYWKKYFKGTTEADKNGEMVELGGSSVNNLADSQLAFGLVPGSANLVETTYRVFGDVVKAQYPELVPNYYPASQVIDTSYLQTVAQQLQPAARKTYVANIQKARPTYKKGVAVKKILSRRVWNITFNPGKNSFSPQARQTLEQLSRELLVASGTVVEVHGHTDNQGDPRKSLPLSESRAFAVKQWLQNRAPVNFPDGRVRVFAHGESQPLVPNSSDANRAKNRRVEIVLGTTG